MREREMKAGRNGEIEEIPRGQREIRVVVAEGPVGSRKVFSQKVRGVRMHSKRTRKETKSAFYFKQHHFRYLVQPLASSYAPHLQIIAGAGRKDDFEIGTFRRSSSVTRRNRLGTAESETIYFVSYLPENQPSKYEREN